MTRQQVKHQRHSDNMKIDKGIYPGMGMETYHAWKLEKENLKAGPISNSMLKAFFPNPYEWLKAPAFKQTDAMRIGSLYDLALTDPDSLTAQTMISPFDNYRTKEAQLWKAQMISLGKIIISDDDMADAIHAVDMVHSHPIAGAIMKNAQFQVAVIGEIGGIPAKCLIDILPDAEGDYCETIIDYKTTSNGLDDESIRKTIGDYKYHWQAAFYKSLFNQVSPDRVCSDYGFLFQSTKTHEVRVVMLSDDALCLGTKAVKQAVIDYAKCAYGGIRSRYLTTCDSLDLMPYHAMNEDELLNIMEGGLNE